MEILNKTSDRNNALDSLARQYGLMYQRVHYDERKHLYIPTGSSIDNYIRSWFDKIDDDGNKIINLGYLDVFGNTTDTMNTANTYRISKAGKYAIPLVYGNAITNGEVYRNAWTAEGLASEGNSNCIQVFYNAYDTGITSAYIKDDITANNHDLDSCSVVWSEVENLISVEPDIVNSDGLDCLIFNIDNFACGNALVAVKDEEGTIVWSWQIWCTDEVITEEKLELSSVQPTMLSHNIGQMPKDEYGNKMSSSYQYGRKDPFPITDSVYPSSAWSQTPKREEAKTFGYLTQHPNHFVKNQTGPTYNNGNGAQYNTWSMSLIGHSLDNITYKTIYDPSPAGYCVPRYNTLDGYTLNTSYIVDSNSDGKIDVSDFDGGLYLKRTIEDVAGGGVFFQFTNGRNSLGQKSADNNTVANYWYAVTSGRYSAWSFHFDSSGYYRLHYDVDRGTAVAIRPQKIEE